MRSAAGLGSPLGLTGNCWIGHLGVESGVFDALFVDPWMQ